MRGNPPGQRSGGAEGPLHPDELSTGGADGGRPGGGPTAPVARPWGAPPVFTRSKYEERPASWLTRMARLHRQCRTAAPTAQECPVTHRFFL